jgi:hypothetical protein
MTTRLTSTIFLTGEPVIKSKEQKKLSRLAYRPASRIKALRKPAPVIVTVFSAKDPA